MPTFEELVRRLEMVERKLSVPIPRTPTCLGSAEATVVEQLDIQHSAAAQGAFAMIASVAADLERSDPRLRGLAGLLRTALRQLGYASLDKSTLCAALETDRGRRHLEKGVDGEWYYRGRPAHQVVIRKFLDGLKPGVVLRVLAPSNGDKP